MLNHDQNTIEPEVKETEPVLDTELESGADSTSKSTVEGEEQQE